jgi:hypothetical protein
MYFLKYKIHKNSNFIILKCNSRIRERFFLVRRSFSEGGSRPQNDRRGNCHPEERSDEGSLNLFQIS